jgi:membrane protein
MMHPRLIIRRAQRFLQSEIWRASSLEDRTLTGWFHRIVRIILLTIRGVNQNHLMARAGSLAFSTILGLAPLVAISIPVGALILGQDEGSAVRWLSKVVTYIAPHMVEYERQADAERSRLEAPGLDSMPRTPDQEDSAPGILKSDLNPRLVEVLDGIIQTARSGTLGVVGALLLIVVAINLFVMVETTFNDIWRAKRGRSWIARVMVYWTVLTLGSLIALSALSMISLAASVRLESLAFGAELSRLIRIGAAPAAALLLVGVLTIFYKTMPNTPVRISAAFTGAFFTALLLVVNHYSASVYVGRVLLEKSFYGQLGIIFVLMAGLYIFWLFVLLGAQVSYAFQNANYLCRDPDWENLSFRTRESYTFLVFLQVARAFRACEPARSVLEIAQALHLPNTVVHRCLTELQSLGYLHFIEADDTDEIQTHRVQPARPLDTISLADFRRHFETLGVDREDTSLYSTDPLLTTYRKLVDDAPKSALATTTMDTFIASCPRLATTETARPLPAS